MRRRRRSFGKRPSFSSHRKQTKFYTDSKGRKRPITPKGPRGQQWRGVLPPQSVSLPSDQVKSVVKVTLPMAEYAFGVLAQSAPFVGQIYTTVQVAKLMYQCWGTIRDMSKTYDRNGWGGVAKATGKEIAGAYLSSKQADIVWRAIKDKIPPQYSETAKVIVKLAVDKLTDEEVDYVDRWLSRN